MDFAESLCDEYVFIKTNAQTMYFFVASLVEAARLNNGTLANSVRENGKLSSKILNNFGSLFTHCLPKTQAMHAFPTDRRQCKLVPFLVMV